jgi:hypothetical protein
MKKISIFLALLALMFTELAFGAGAVATSITGQVTVQTGSASPRMLRQGDELQQGDTIMTGAASAAVLKFDDGQIAALTANSRMTITAYQYNPQTGGGNVLLSLIGGGMRAITGLIGKRSPSQVAFRAATATIGIRGSDGVMVVTPQGEVFVTVSEGAFTFQLPGQPLVVVQTGEAIRARPDGTFSRGAAAAIMRELRGTPGGDAILAVLNSIETMQSAVNQANTGPRQQPAQEGQQPGQQGEPGTTSTPGQPGTPQGGGAGGGRPSGG